MNALLPPSSSRLGRCPLAGRILGTLPPAGSMRGARRADSAALRLATAPAPPPLLVHRRLQPCRAVADGPAGGADAAAAVERLHEAAEAGKLAELQAAIEALQHPESDVDVMLARGSGDAAVPRAAIHRAAAAGRETCLKLLLLSGADRDQPDGAGRTPLWLAAAAGHSECVEVLLSGGVNKHTADAAGRTAVHAAAAAGQELPLRQLLNARATVDAKDAAGSRPLHLAAAAGDVPSLRALLSAGASVYAVDGAGLTARQVARAAGHAPAELYLLAVQSTTKAFPGRPTRAELLGGEGELADAYRLACAAQRARGTEGQAAAEGELQAAVHTLVRQQGQEALLH